MGKIAILIPTLGIGGAEKIAAEHANLLAEEGHKVDIILLSNTIKQTINKNIDIITASKRENQTIITKILSTPSLVIKLVKLEKRHKYTTVISHMERANILNLVLDFFHKTNRITYIHTNVNSFSKRGLAKKLFIQGAYKLLLHRSTSTFTVSHESKNIIENKFNIKNIEVAKNFFDISKIIDMSKVKLDEPWGSLFKTKKVILACGRLVEAKGYKNLLTAYAQAKKKNKDLALVIVGDGPLRKPLQAHADKLGTDLDIYFTGENPNPYKFMSQAEAFVSSSLWEGFGNVLIESLATGLSTISTSCPAGPKEILGGDNFSTKKITQITHCKFGLLVPSVEDVGEKQSIEMLTAAILTVTSENKTHDKENLIEYAKTYDKSEMGRKFIQLITTYT